MLPFLKPKTVAGLIISKRKPDGGSEESHSEGNENDSIEASAEALIRAVHAKDAKAVASAMRDAFQILESEPHEEAGESESTASPHTYDSQNAAAAKNRS